MKKIIMGISVVVLAAVTAYPAHAASTFPGENDVIAFTKGSHGRVWTVDPTAGNATPLLKQGSSDVTWAPGGNSLAYVRGGHVFVATSAGKTIYRVPCGSRMSDGDPQWSSDGTKLAFVRTKSDGQKAVYSVRVGQNPRSVSGWARDKNYRAPSWAPSGRQIVYEEYTETSARLLVKNLAAHSVRELTSLSDITNSPQAAWSPSGKKILYRDSAQELYTIWPDGTHRAVISDGESYDGSWSSDGSKIAFIEAPNDDHVSISEADGTIRWIPVERGADSQLGAPVWSPDGTKLAFTLGSEAGRGVFTLDIATGVQQLVTKSAGTEMVSWRAVSPRH